LRVLVTGAAGYIGSVVTELLCDGGHDVLALDNLANGHRGAVDPRASFQLVDLLDYGAVWGTLQERPLDAVVHLAGEIEVGKSARDPGLFYSANLTAGVGLLQAMVEADVKRIVFSSTAAVYGQPDVVPIPEEAAGNPCNPYGETKWAFERAMRWYEAAYGLRHISLRYFNACGATEAHGEDHRPETHIMPLLLDAAMGKRDSFRIFGSDYDTPDGTCVRDYVHVVDIAGAHILALGSMDALGSTAFNLGHGEGYSNLQVVDRVREVTGRDIDVRMDPRRPGDPVRLVADSRKIRSVLGWKPKYPDLESMVKTAWQWRLGHPDGYR
jgi:UDP-glucose 4-epimerase